MIKVKNPILQGFNPDPSIIYVDGWYYIANSTFEWYPGVQIHKSTDLINWELASRPLKEYRLLDMRGNPSSSGVWAPCLSYCDGLFYLVYSNMKTWNNDPFKDSYNFITTATSIEGDWSDPVYINSSGFDASLFHDDDGRKWFLNMEWNHLKSGKEQFSGILLQEYDADKKKLVGKVSKIFLGTELGLVEGPHLYKKDGRYYLLCAEGGTSYEHAEVAARSENIYGPYQVHPMKQILSAMNTNAINQKAGHASMCEGKNGEWYLAHLSGRPLRDYRCVLGRETSLQRLVWKDGWMYLENGTSTPSDFIELEGEVKKKSAVKKYIFSEQAECIKDFQTLRKPITSDNFILTNQGLQIIGKDSPVSCYDQSVLAIRQTDFSFEATACLEYNPDSFQHMAGLTYRYNEANQYYLFMSYNESLNKRVLSLMVIDDGKHSFSEQIILKSDTVYLKLNVDRENAQFYFSEDGKKYSKIGAILDSTIMSDEYARPMGFTGAFVGLAAQDLKEHCKTALYKWFEYKKVKGDD